MEILKYVLLWFCVGGIMLNALVDMKAVRIVVPHDPSTRIKVIFVLMATILPVFIGTALYVAFRKR